MGKKKKVNKQTKKQGRKQLIKKKLLEVCNSHKNE